MIEKFIFLFYSGLFVHYALQNEAPHEQLRLLKPKSVWKRYMVFIIGTKPPEEYDQWVCGGAIVSPFYAITSAACLMQSTNLFAVPENPNISPDINKDCSADVKRKVILKCLPKGYTFNYSKPEMWGKHDIGLAKVQARFNVPNKTLRADGCIYGSSMLKINFNEEYEKTGVSAYVLGWGTNATVRQPGESRGKLNAKYLEYSTMKIVEKKICYAEYRDWPLIEIISKSMICADGDGDIAPPKLKKLRKDNQNGQIEVQSKYDKYIEDSKFSRSTRRGGICQNDHGDPMITTIDSQEQMIGVASQYLMFKENFSCVGPFLFTSIVAYKDFILCILKDDPEYKPPNYLRNFNYDSCDRVSLDRGYEIFKQNIKWKRKPGRSNVKRNENANLSTGSYALARVAFNIPRRPIKKKKLQHKRSSHSSYWKSVSTSIVRNPPKITKRTIRPKGRNLKRRTRNRLKHLKTRIKS